MLFSEPKIPQLCQRRRVNLTKEVSVLFSEPKIPQRRPVAALSRDRSVSVLFSEPKIPQEPSSTWRGKTDMVSVLFSEPKIPQLDRNRRIEYNPEMFQCSSASRKFLNAQQRRDRNHHVGFSALQRAENSSTRPSHLRPSIFPTAMITLRHS